MINFLLAACFAVAFLGITQGEGISHFAHLMLKAAENGDSKSVIEYITEKGVFITTKNNYGVSAIIFAANNGHLELLEQLVKIGADIEDRSNNWRTPLIWASLWGHYSVVNYLVNIGANLSVFDKDGMTPLMSATLGGHTKVVNFLLENGADPTTKNFYNGTALSIAQVKENKELVAILKPYYPDNILDDSPYIIMLNLIQRELLTLFKVSSEEAVKQYNLFLAYSKVVHYWITNSAFNTMYSSLHFVDSKDSRMLNEEETTCSRQVENYQDF